MLNGARTHKYYYHVMMIKLLVCEVMSDLFFGVCSSRRLNVAIHETHILRNPRSDGVVCSLLLL